MRMSVRLMKRTYACSSSFVTLRNFIATESMCSSTALNTNRNKLSKQHYAFYSGQAIKDKYIDRNKNKSRNNTNYLVPVLAAAAAAAVGMKIYFDYDHCNPKCSEKVSSEKVFSREEVSKRKTKATGIWVIYGHNIYDITEFVDGHPGGMSKIILASGGNLEPYWDMYAIHKKPEVLEILQQYHIGILREEDWVVEDEKKAGPFVDDPKRHPALIANSTEPFNAETPTVLAVDDLVTPNDLFFVRNHLPVPNLNEKNCTLSVEGNGTKLLVLTVEELKKKFHKVTYVAALQCAGNRRSEMNPIKKVKGLSWSHNAISNAEWGGALLRDVLLSAGVNPDDKNVKHIHFEGADKDPTGASYGASIPSNRIFEKNSPILIAYEMNGKPLPRDHGFPLRIVAPGIVGARNVKWLTRISISDKEYDGHWQQNDYKPFSPNIDWNNVDFSKSPAIQELPVTSAICFPPEGSSIHEDEEVVTVKGYAFSGGGHGIIRVDVSVDAGKTWHTAELTQAEQDIDHMFSWSLWKCTVPIPNAHGGKMEVVCKAVDSSCNTQPENVGPVWNLRGVLNNSWHRLNINVETE